MSWLAPDSRRGQSHNPVAIFVVGLVQHGQWPQPEIGKRQGPRFDIQRVVLILAGPTGFEPSPLDTQYLILTFPAPFTSNIGLMLLAEPHDNSPVHGNIPYLYILYILFSWQNYFLVLPSVRQSFPAQSSLSFGGLFWGKPLLPTSSYKGICNNYVKK